MSPDELRNELVRRTLAKLGEELDLHHTTMDEVLALCEVQLGNTRFSKAAVGELMRSFPQDPAEQEAWFDQQVSEAVAEVRSAEYVADCERIAQFLHPDTDQATCQRIIDDYRYNAAYRRWMYGGRAEEEEPDRGRSWGSLGARLIAALGRSQAAVRFAEAQAMVEEKVFAADAFTECLAEYCPRMGMKFENFLKRRISWRAGDVARWMRRNPQPGEPPSTRGRLELDAILRDVSDRLQEDDTEDLETAFRDCLEECRRRRDDVELAAFELRYKAYWDPDKMTAPTRGLVEQHLGQLKNEFHVCQEDLRKLEDELPNVEHRCEVAWHDAEQSRHALDQEGCSPSSIVDLECEASRRNKGDLEKELEAAKHARRSQADVLRIQFMVHFKSLALARGRRETARKRWEKWAQCRLPWVRTETEVARLIGNASQPTVSRCLERITGCLRKCLGGDR